MTDDWWEAGASIVDRYRSSKASSIPVPTRSSRIQEWRELSFWTNESLRERLLSSMKLSEESFAVALSDTTSLSSDQPNWSAGVYEAYTELQPYSTDSCNRFISELAHPFIYPFLPLINSIYSPFAIEMVAFERDNKSCISWLSLNQDISKYIGDRLMAFTFRVLILELQCERLLGSLEGITPEERFDFFIRKYSEPTQALALLREYPLLAKLIHESLHAEIKFAGELIVRFCKDLNRLTERFDLVPGTILCHITMGLGDPHRGGKTVSKLTMSNGISIIYLPRAVALDVHFGNLVDILNQTGGALELRTRKIVDVGDHGWAEYVTARPCTSSDELMRFYERQGAWLALLYSLEGTDFHAENLIAVGEHPYLIDLEGLFHPRHYYDSSSKSQNSALSLLADSVMRVGFLPYKLYVAGRKPPSEESGLGRSAGQRTNYRMPKINCNLADEMTVTMDYVDVSESENRPTLNGSPVATADFCDSVVKGFVETYNRLLDSKAELLRPKGPIAVFESACVRVVLRPTKLYVLLGMQLVHPDHLRDGRDQDFVLSKLWSSVETDEFMDRVIPHESRDLIAGDIPIFNAGIGSTDLQTSFGEKIPDFLVESPLTSVIRRIALLSQSDRDKQVTIIQNSLTMLASAGHGDDLPANELQGAGFASGGELLAQACAIADELLASSFRTNSTIDWLALQFIEDEFWSFQPMGFDFYNGGCGLCITFAYLYKETQNTEYRKAAELISSCLSRHLDDITPLALTNVPIGFHSGLAGWAYLFTHLHTLFQDSRYYAEALRCFSLIGDRLNASEAESDVIGGTAGVLLSALACQKVNPSFQILGLIRDLADALMSSSERQRVGLAWPSKRGHQHPLTGFSHGTSGCAYALLEASAFLDEKSYRDAALSAFEYEDSTFSQEQANWPDFRRGANSTPDISEDLPYMCEWCHGAPGIGLARIKHYDLLTESLQSTVVAALNTTIRSGFGRNHCLCHGDLGSAELFIQAAKYLPQFHAKEVVSRIRASVYSSLQKRGPLCGTPRNVSTPGFMMGLAGIAYGLCRLAYPDRFPSILSIEPPCEVL